MNFRDRILNTALLGTDKKQLISGELSPDLAALFDHVQGRDELDNEEKFLQIASLAFNYTRCGLVPYKLNVFVENVAPEEDKTYCTDSAIKVLKDILAEDAEHLLKIWLDECNSKGYVVIPQMVPFLLNRAAKSKTNRRLLAQCCGRRGEWLIGLNKDWQVLVKGRQEEHVWENGTAEQRRSFLRETREKEPAAGREILIATWPVENASSRAELLKQMEVNIGDGDKDWLETLLAEKSQKVKDEAMRLLKMVPGSSILRQYWKIVKEAVQLKKEKGFLGIGSKMVLCIQQPVINDESVFKSGVDKLSKNKEISDDDFILIQLISEVPPQWWEAHLSTNPKDIIGYFEKEERTKRFLFSVAAGAVVKFKDLNWAVQLAYHSSIFFPDILPLLSSSEQEKYFGKHTSLSSDLLDYAVQMNTEWSLLLTRNVLAYVCDNIKQWYSGSQNYNRKNNSYNKIFYKDNIHRIPIDVIRELKLSPPSQDELARTVWENTDGYLTKLLTIKQNIYKAFA